MWHSEGVAGEGVLSLAQTRSASFVVLPKGRRCQGFKRRSCSSRSIAGHERKAGFSLCSSGGFPGKVDCMRPSIYVPGRRQNKFKNIVEIGDEIN